MGTILMKEHGKKWPRTVWRRRKLSDIESFLRPLEEEEERLAFDRRFSGGRC
jgi:hypothetical protein